MKPSSVRDILEQRLAFARRFANDKGGNVALMVSASTVALVIAGGSGLDISNFLTAKTELQAAADAAALAGITKTSKAYTDAIQMGPSGEITDGENQALAAFNANVRNINSVNNISSSFLVRKSGLQITSNVTASATYTPSFASLLGVQTIPMQVTSTAATSMPKYIDFYLSVDVSGSMGLATTAAEQARLQNLIGCTFACHQGAGNSFDATRTNGTPGQPVIYCPTPGTSNCIQIRLDAVGYAVTHMLDVANTSQLFQSQYRVGIYPFIRYTDFDYAPLTANLTSLQDKALGLPNELDTGVNDKLGSGGTHFENVLPNVADLITSTGVGDGSSSSSRVPFIFFITDGSQDNQWYLNGAWGGTGIPNVPARCISGVCGPWYNTATTIDPTLCDYVKQKGITLSILYIPYIPVTHPRDIYNLEDYYSNDNIPNIGPKLQTCASPGFFHTADSPTDIDTALQAMFQQAVDAVRLTH